MEVTVDQALQKGVEAHKAGKVQEADRYYTAILKAQPTHPDANHNMGVLAVGVGKVQQALPFFKTALEANPNIAQFWLSYIDALIKLERIDVAKAVIDQVKSKGFNDKIFDQLYQRLHEANEINDASKVATDLQKSSVNYFVKSFNQGEFQKILEQSPMLSKQYPDQPIIWNITGAAAARLGLLDKAILAFKEAIRINPDYAEAYYNIGNVRRKQGNLDQAIEAYNQAILLKPGYAEAFNNLGNLLKEQGNLPEAHYNLGRALEENGELDKAKDLYNKATSMNPNYGEAYNGIANVLKEQGNLDQSIEAYNKAISLKPGYAEAIEKLLSLQVQLAGSKLIKRTIYDGSQKINSKVEERPKVQILKAINAFNCADQDLSRRHIKNFNKCEQKLLDGLTKKDKKSCLAFSNFLSKLNEKDFDSLSITDQENSVYHFGESHCLSYAHHFITIKGIKQKIVPKITFGAKAFHFSLKIDSKFTAITENNLNNVPNGSNLFLSFGEIDCRPNEGFLGAASKLKRSVESLIYETIIGYVSWFAKKNKFKKHNLFFFNVPAPVYNKTISEATNYEVANAIKVFNNVMGKHVLEHNFNEVDVFRFTVGDDGFSNGNFHIDNNHLGNAALAEIEKQLNK